MINENISDFATSDGEGGGTYTVTRRAAGTRTLGVYTPGAASTVSGVEMVVQPYGGKTLVVKPEGFHVEDVRRIFTAFALVATAGREDVVTISGEAFKVFRVEGPWELDGDVHYEALAARQVVP